MPGMPAGFAGGPPPGGSISPSQLASQAAYTVLGNSTPGAASPTAVLMSDPTMNGAIGLQTKTASFTVGAAEWAFNVSTAAGNVTVTMPNPALFVGRGVFIHKSSSDANTITPAAFASETFNGSAASALPGSSFANYPAWFLFSDGTNWWF